MANLRFLLLDVGYQARRGNRITPLVVKVPQEVRELDRDRARQLAALAMKSKDRDPGYPFIICEHDIGASPEIRAMFDAVDWVAVEESGVAIPDNARDAFNYVEMVGAPVPELEPLIASSGSLAYQYAIDFLHDPFPVGEEAISMDLMRSLNYSVFLGCRIRPAEERLSENETLASSYGVAMSKHKLWESWGEDEVARSPVWMYQYAKDHLKGALPGSLHNKMYLLSVSDPSNKWMKKYFKAKKYRLGRA